jgi:hypothetical protein
MKYHVALSFAGEDREYVEIVANNLRDSGVNVFYDLFEEHNLWGKDLYGHLSSVYKDQALYTVMFVSKWYKKKLWGNHERKSAQARAFSESREYILPAKFDIDVEIPGLLDTTGYIDLRKKSPEDFARTIVRKLTESGVELGVGFNYADEVKEDIDFPINDGSIVSNIVKDLKSYNWYIQNPAIEKIFKLKWESLDSSLVFILGRNFYQCACGGERKAESILSDLRRELATLPKDKAIDFINGMFFEVYFNSQGEFRGDKLKGRCLPDLLKLQSVSKFKTSISFIRQSLEPFKNKLPFLPSVKPEIVSIHLKIKMTDKPLIKSILINGYELLVSGESARGNIWRLSLRKFTVNELRVEMSNEWDIPYEQIAIVTNKEFEDGVKFRLPEENTIKRPLLWN